MNVKAFRDWKFEEVELTFGIEPVFEHPLLTDWLSVAHSPSEDDKQTLEKLRDKLLRAINTYNEEELKSFFISPLLSLVPFEGHGLRPFMDRPFSFEYGQDDLGNPLVASGRVNWLLAKGRLEPRAPRVFLHEYKREVMATGEPIGQLLIAMVGARQQNTKISPLYGCYVLGRNWFFVVLDEQQYAVSKAFDATQDDVFGIYSALYEVQQRVAELVA
ncbi:MAG: hypothetical protein WA958_04925 [Tunicatimonas sp.]